MRQHLATSSVFSYGEFNFLQKLRMITRMGGATMVLPIQASFQSTIPLSTRTIGVARKLGFGGSGFVVCCSKGGNDAESASSWGDGGEVSRLRRENTELRASLAELSQSLASISSALAEVSRAVQRVANAVDYGNSPSENGVLAATTTSPTPEIADGIRDPPTLFPEELVLEAIQDPVQAQLMEQNKKAHNLAYRLQQAFFQARIEGLGKPFQLAAEDFVTTCLEAHAMGIGLRELQLQLILLEGSLTGAFGIQNQRHLDAPVMSEESRVRSSWVRLVFTTLAEVKERRSRVVADAGNEREQPDPSDGFVKELVALAFEKGYDLERVKLEQSVSGPVTSTAIKTMRQCTYLVLLTLQKIINDAV